MYSTLAQSTQPNPTQGSTHPMDTSAGFCNPAQHIILSSFDATVMLCIGIPVCELQFRYNIYFMNARRLGLHDRPARAICYAAVVRRILFTRMYTQAMVIRTAEVVFPQECVYGCLC